MRILAPIILFVYNRPWHTRQTLEALKANDLAKDSVLYIFSDGPKRNAIQKDLANIEEVRSLISVENWCGKVKIIERRENLGLADSVIKGVSEVINIHGKVIVLEDDIVTGKYFLKFMNDALNIYEQSRKVFGISAYKYPSLKEIKSDTFFLPISSSWSFATWINRWHSVNFNGKELLSKIEKNSLEKKLDFGGNPFYMMLKDQIEGRNDSWAIRFYVSMFLENAYFLYPNKSLITNIGFDNTGVHCGPDDYYSKNQRSNKKIKVLENEIKLNKGITISTIKSFENKFKHSTNKGSLIRKVIQKIKKKINFI